jgi:hypothetical protein
LVFARHVDPDGHRRVARSSADALVIDAGGSEGRCNLLRLADELPDDRRKSAVRKFFAMAT